MLGKRLSELRKIHKLRQEDLANKIGIARTTYAMYEQGKREPDYDTLQKLADFFDVTTDYLLGRTDKKKFNAPYTAPLTEKDELDIAKRLEQIKNEVEHTDALAFDGEPLSEEAKESFLDAMEFIVREAKRMNKKYTPKKYRKDNMDE